MGSGTRWLLLAMTAVLCGCSAAPELSMVREPELDTARDRMFGLYNEGTKVATVAMDTPATDVALENRLVALESSVEEILAAVKAPKEEGAAPLSGAAAAPAPAEPAVAVSPAIDWPAGCVCECWVAAYCQPCEKWVEEEMPKLPSGVVTVRQIAMAEEEAKRKAVPGGPYFIIYGPGGADLIRRRGFATAESLAETARRAVAPQTNATAGTTGDATWQSVPETWPARVKINGTNRPSKQTLIWHLRGGGNHAATWHSGFPYEQMTTGQLATLHDGDHGYSMEQAVQYSQPVRYYSQPVRYSTTTMVRSKGRVCRKCL
jgi:hypothetical protein